MTQLSTIVNRTLPYIYHFHYNNALYLYLIQTPILYLIK